MTRWRWARRGWRLALCGAALSAAACDRNVRTPVSASGERARPAPEAAFRAPPSLDSVPPAGALPLSRGNPAAGRLIYASYCVHCHGTRGAGDGRLARTLSPPPADLRWLDLPRQTNQVFAALKSGVPPQHGAFMPDGGKLFGDQQLWDVIAYLPALAASR